MDVKQVLHMNGGGGETSYARNSLPQRSVILKTKPLIEAAVEEFFSSAVNKPPGCLNIADLACSSGPNSLLPTALILDAVHDAESCRRQSAGGSSTTTDAPREFQVFLNDLPGNDFNIVLKAVPPFYERLREGKGEGFGPCFVSGTPGSFYERLFPTKTMHFVHCANSLHWLSQIPPRVVDDELLRLLNKGEIAVGKSSSTAIFDAYLEQFQKDFAAFLESRSQEIVPGGHMILSLVVRRRRNPFAEENYSVWDDLASSLRELAAVGMFREEKLESFNLPYYEPHREELEEVIRAQGSFDVVRLVEAREASRLDSDESCRTIDCSTQANCFRAVIEPLLVNHFGEEAAASSMEELFDRFEDKLSRRDTHMVTVLFVSLVRKC